ncbi:RNA polymerase sigma factor [Patulibacter sp. S7RM1-6]
MAEPPHSALRRSRRDPQAFSAFYAEEAPRMVVFFARRVLDPEAALDLTAETFAAAFVSRRSFRGTDERAARAWVRTIGERQLAAYLRKGYADRAVRRRLGLERPPARPEELQRVEELAALDALRTAVAEELRDLPDGEREAVRLRVVEELEFGEVAARLQISEVAARKRVSRALGRMGERLRPLREEATA